MNGSFLSRSADLDTDRRERQHLRPEWLMLRDEQMSAMPSS